MIVSLALLVAGSGENAQQNRWLAIVRRGSNLPKACVLIQTQLKTSYPNMRSHPNAAQTHLLESMRSHSNAAQTSSPNMRSANIFPKTAFSFKHSRHLTRDRVGCRKGWRASRRPGGRSSPRRPRSRHWQRRCLLRSPSLHPSLCTFIRVSVRRGDSPQHTTVHVFLRDPTLRVSFTALRCPSIPPSLCTCVFFLGDPCLRPLLAFLSLRFCLLLRRLLRSGQPAAVAARALATE